MLKAQTTQDAELEIVATVRGIAVYLDNHSFINLSKDTSGLRARFVSILGQGSDLLFSLTNSVEFSGPQGRSLDMLRTFLDEIGAHWFPLELDPSVVVERERQGKFHQDACISEEFIKTYFRTRIEPYTPGSGKIIDLSEDFFRLSVVTDNWVESRRNQIKQNLARMDRALIEQVQLARDKVRFNPGLLDTAFPEMAFDPQRPATFAYVNLLRQLVCNPGH